MSNVVGEQGSLVEVSVVVMRIILRKHWKSTDYTPYGRSAEKTRRDLYVCKDRSGCVYTITIATSNAFKTGDEFVLKGTVKHNTTFNGANQSHISPWSLVLKPRK